VLVELREQMETPARVGQVLIPFLEALLLPVVEVAALGLRQVAMEVLVVAVE
jgi:hypothetical protein